MDTEWYNPKWIPMYDMVLLNWIVNEYFENCLNISYFIVSYKKHMLSSQFKWSNKKALYVPQYAECELQKFLKSKPHTFTLPCGFGIEV